MERIDENSLEWHCVSAKNMHETGLELSLDIV
jgi:hypothetical protein